MIDSFEYFMVRVRRSADNPGVLTGQVERLGTGEKQAFLTGSQLIRLVAAWPETGGGTGETVPAPEVELRADVT
jgi:hypothetical protein